MPWNAWLEVAAIVLLACFLLAGLVGLLGFRSLQGRVRREIGDELDRPQPGEDGPRRRFKELERLP